MPLPMTPALLDRFAQSTGRYADTMVRAADVDGNGKLKRSEAVALGDLKDTYDLYVRKGVTVSTEKFLQFYKDYARVSAKRGELPTDLQDNYKNWLAAILQVPPTGPVHPVEGGGDQQQRT